MNPSTKIQNLLRKVLLQLDIEYNITAYIAAALCITCCNVQHYYSFPTYIWIVFRSKTRSTASEKQCIKRRDNVEESRPRSCYILSFYIQIGDDDSFRFLLIGLEKFEKVLQIIIVYDDSSTR